MCVFQSFATRGLALRWHARRAISGNDLMSVPPEIGQLLALTCLLVRLWQCLVTIAFKNSLILIVTTMSGSDLSHNRLTSLPPEIGQLAALQTL